MREVREAHKRQKRAGAGIRLQDSGPGFFDVRLAAHVLFARHGRALTGESPEYA